MTVPIEEQNQVILVQHRSPPLGKLCTRTAPQVWLRLTQSCTKLRPFLPSSPSSSSTCTWFTDAPLYSSISSLFLTVIHCDISFPKDTVIVVCLGIFLNISILYFYIFLSFRKGHSAIQSDQNRAAMKLVTGVMFMLWAMCMTCGQILTRSVKYIPYSAIKHSFVSSTVLLIYSLLLPLFAFLDRRHRLLFNISILQLILTTLCYGHPDWNFITTFHWISGSVSCNTCHF